jgi:drug/metabolite transporter (DMT)-like permease
MRHKKIIIGGLIALCGLALLVQHVAELGSNFHGDHLVAGLLMLAVAVIFWCLSSEANKE